jgi:hypothetical protein
MIVTKCLSKFRLASTLSRKHTTFISKWTVSDARDTCLDKSMAEHDCLLVFSDAFSVRSHRLDEIEISSVKYSEKQ